MTSTRENNSVVFKDTQQYKMPPQSITVCTLKGKIINDCVIIWAEKQVPHPALLKWKWKELWCIDTTEGLTFSLTQSPPLCAIQSVIHHGPAQLFSPGSGVGCSARSHPPPSCSTSTSCGEWVGRSEMSILWQSQVFLLDNFLFHIPLLFPFLFFWIFPTFRFCDPFFMASPLSHFFPHDSLARVHNSCWQRTYWGEWAPDRCCCYPVGPLLRVGSCFAALLLNSYLRLPAWKSPSLFT